VQSLLLAGVVAGADNFSGNPALKRKEKPVGDLD